MGAVDARELIERARRGGLRLTPDGDLLQVRGPKSTSNNILVEQLRDAKVEILALLAAEPELAMGANVRSMSGVRSDSKPYQQQEREAMSSWLRGD